MSDTETLLREWEQAESDYRYADPYERLGMLVVAGDALAAALRAAEERMTVPDPTTEALTTESGYGLLLRTVASSIEATDPDAAQALARAAVDVEGFVARLRAAEEREQKLRETAHQYRTLVSPDYGDEDERMAADALSAALAASSDGGDK